MKKKKILKKLAAAALGLGLGVSATASASAMSPKSLWENHIQNESKSSISQKYEQQIQEELGKNLSNRYDVYVADFFLNGKIPERSHPNVGPNEEYHLDAVEDYAIPEAERVLNGRSLDPNDEKATIFKEFVFQELLDSQSKINDIKSDVENKMAQLKNNRMVPLNNLYNYSFNPIIKQKIAIINGYKQNCQYFANMILGADASLRTVDEWKKSFDENYNAIQKNVQESLSYISNALRMINNLRFINMPNNNFNNMFNHNFNNMFNHNFNNMFNNNFNNIPNNRRLQWFKTM